MGSLFEKITDWIKEGLMEAITQQYTSIFSSVNDQVADVAAQIGQTPQGWNGGVFSTIQNLSESVVIPIAGMILTFVMVYELIQMILEKNNMHDFDTFNIYKWAFKTAAAAYLLTNCFTIGERQQWSGQAQIHHLRNRSGGFAQCQNKVGAYRN